MADAGLTDRFEKRERFAGHPEAGYDYVLGGAANLQMSAHGMAVSVGPASLGSEDLDLWDIRIHGPGSSTIQSIRTLDKALRIAAYLYDELNPEHEAERARRDRKFEEYEAERGARDERERPAREKAAREREKLLATIETEDAAKCPECAHVDDPDEFDMPGYECSRCGSTGSGPDGRRCDQCHIFRAKSSDTSCPSCEAPVEPETVPAKNLNGVWCEINEEEVTT